MIFGISSTIGAGIFAFTGLASNYTGPSVCLSFLIAGIVALLTGLVFAEMSGWVPFSGSTYSYVYTSLGEYPAWLVGWCQILRCGLTGCALARAWAEYIIGLLTTVGVSNIPDWIHHLDLGNGVYASPLASVFVVICHLILLWGSKESLYFTNILTIAKLVFVFFIIIASIFYVNSENWYPFLKNGFNGVLTGSSIVFFGYLGFDSITVVAEESINPWRDIPWAVLCSTTFCGVVYILMSLLICGVASMEGLNAETAVAVVFTERGATWVAVIVFIGGFLGLSTAGYAPFLT